MEQELLTEKAAAEYLHLTPRTLQAWRYTGLNGPKFVRISKRCVRYRQRDLEAWLESRLCQNTVQSSNV